MRPESPTLPLTAKRLRLRLPGSAAAVYDVSDLKAPKSLGNTYYLFGSNDPQTTAGLSKQWLTEIAVAQTLDEAGKVVLQAVEAVGSGDPKGNGLKLGFDYNCSAVGKDLRILRKDLANVEDQWHYVIVDEAEKGSKMEVTEIWVSNSAIDLDSLINADLQVKGGKVPVATIKARVKDGI